MDWPWAVIAFIVICIVVALYLGAPAKWWKSIAHRERIKREDEDRAEWQDEYKRQNYGTHDRSNRNSTRTRADDH